MRICISLLLSLLLLLPFSAPADVVEHLIRFQSASLEPSPFMERISETRGVPVRRADPGPVVEARLVIPHQSESVPAVVLFPVCKGWIATPKRWQQTLVNWGYAIVEVRSVEARPEQAGNCDASRYDGIVGASDIVFDGIGVLQYLEKIPEIDRDRVAVMGWGLGGTSAMKAVNAQGYARLFKQRFRAAIAFYPNCELHSEYLAPSLVFIGSEDKLANPLLCEVMRKETMESQRAMFDLSILPGAGHRFDVNESTPELLVNQVELKIRSFLEAQIGRPGD